MAAEPHGTVDPHAAAAAGAHGGEASGGFPPFDAALFSSQLFWFALTFGALYFIMSRVALPKVASVLASRDSALRKDRDEAAEKTAQAEAARAAMESAVAKARSDARGVIEDMRAKVQAGLNNEQAAAEAKIAARIDTAEGQIAAARTKALGEVPGVAASLARDIADQVLRGNATASAAPALQSAASGER